MKNRISNLTQGKELPIMNLRLSKALVMLLLCCMLIGFADQNASAASAFDRSAFRIAINDMYFEDSASNWYLAGDTGFHVLSDDSNVYADVSIVLNYGAALGGNKQSDVAPVMAIRICETEYGSVHDLQPVTLAFKVANKNYLFTSFTAARGNGNEGFYEIPLDRKSVV